MGEHITGIFAILSNEFIACQMSHCSMLDVPLFCASYTNFNKLILYISRNSILNKHLTTQWIHETKLHVLFHNIKLCKS
jgi:hypothetical protein